MINGGLRDQSSFSSSILSCLYVYDMILFTTTIVVVHNHNVVLQQYSICLYSTYAILIYVVVVYFTQVQHTSCLHKRKKKQL